MRDLTHADLAAAGMQQQQWQPLTSFAADSWCAYANANLFMRWHMRDLRGADLAAAGHHAVSLACTNVLVKLERFSNNSFLNWKWLVLLSVGITLASCF